ncbi:MAG: bile acid:sodium symporter [Candidatus Nanohaloarchaea archaeon]
MPVHGLKADLELAALVGSAGAVSYFIHGEVLSNIMFTFLLGALFFLIGLHLDLDFEKSLDHRLDRLTISVLSVFVLTPVIAYLFSFAAAREAFLVIAASATAIGSPRVWSNLSGGDGKLAGVTGSTSFLLSFIATPVLFYILYPSADLQLLSVNAVKFAAPFVLGLMLRNYESSIVEDMRMHFSKMSFWLITVITLVQVEFLYSSAALDIGLFVIAAVLFAVFTAVSFLAGFTAAESLGFYTRESISVGYTSASKNVALGFLLASQIGGEVIALVGLYYFVRQLTGTALVEFLRRYDISRLKPQY